MTEDMLAFIELFVIHINIYIYIIWSVLYNKFIIYLVIKLHIPICNENMFFSISPV